jgi:hypothetical protein
MSAGAEVIFSLACCVLVGFVPAIAFELGRIRRALENSK